MTKFKPLPPLAALQQQLSYDPETGLFTWDSPSKYNRRVKPGDVAGSLNKSNGYIYIVFMCERYLSHRLAWLFITGSDPAELTIDHIDRDRTNNRSTNLRLATMQQQRWNGPERRGWSIDRSGSYRSVIVHNGKQKHLGTYSTAEEARSVYLEACAEIRGNW